MNSRTRNGLLTAAVLALLAAGLFAYINSPSHKMVKVSVDFQHMGTLINITLYGSEDNCRQAIKKADETMALVEKEFNLYNPESELSRLNASAADKPFACSNEMWLLIQEARQAYDFSNGMFDITVKPIMDLWGFYRKRGNGETPDAAEITETLKKVGLEKVVFDEDEQTVFFPVKGMCLDFGGIAKGYAVDLAVDAVGEFGIERGVVNIGGNLRTLNLPPPGKKAYEIGMRNPFDKDKIMDETVSVLDAALSTSGNYERYVIINGKKYGHIMNPKTGMPTDFLGAVTIIAPSAVLADWLSTSIFIDNQLADSAEKEFPGVKVIIYENTIEDNKHAE